MDRPGQQGLRDAPATASAKELNEGPEESGGQRETFGRELSSPLSSSDAKAVTVEGSRWKLGFFSEQRQKPTNVFDTEQTEVSRRRVTEVTSKTARGWVLLAMDVDELQNEISSSLLVERIEESSILPRPERLASGLPQGLTGLKPGYTHLYRRISRELGQRVRVRPSVEKARTGARSAPHARNLEAGRGGGLRVGGSRPPAVGGRNVSSPHRAGSGVP